MIAYKKQSYPSLTGEHKARITAIEVSDNVYFDPMEDNSTEKVLNIYLSLSVNGNAIKFTQRFVAPIMSEKTIFGKLIKLGMIAHEEEGELDEQKLVGLLFTAKIEKNKKGYDTLIDVLDVDSVKDNNGEVIF